MTIGDEGQDRGKRFEEIAMTVRNRDAGRCRRCGEPEAEERLSVHHLVSDAKLPDDVDSHLPVNLVSLCRSCHSKIEPGSLLSQIQELNIERQEELMLTDETRRKLNDRLKALGSELLNTKKVTREESQDFIENQLDSAGSQTELFDFD